ncbi:MAG: dipeptidyl carboxypeptidase II, partial [Luteimonas sp.]|nr:dipeptidyl carboxypeptidase II [Luteimonas sp.]
MKHPLSLALAMALAAAAPVHAQSAPAANPEAAQPGTDVSKPNDSQAQANPFFVQSPLPLHYPQFDRIKDADFAPAFDRGMADNLKEIEAIAGNPEAPTFDNTIIALEKSGQVLNRATTVFFNLVGTDTNDTRKKLQADYAAKFAEHGDAISLNPKLFARIKTLYDTRASLGLDAQGLRLVERYHTDFVRAGANLSEKDKARLREINSELAALGTKFSQNVLAEVNDSAVVVDTKEELDGLTDEQIAS